MNSMIKDCISLPIIMLAFFAGSAFLHWLVLVFGLTGLPALLVFCIPFLVLLAYTTTDKKQGFWRALSVYSLWGYGFIFGVAGVAGIIN